MTDTALKTWLLAAAIFLFGGFVIDITIAVTTMALLGTAYSNGTFASLIALGLAVAVIVSFYKRAGDHD